MVHNPAVHVAACACSWPHDCLIWHRNVQCSTCLYAHALLRALLHGDGCAGYGAGCCMPGACQAPGHCWPACDVVSTSQTMLCTYARDCQHQLFVGAPATATALTATWGLPVLQLLGFPIQLLGLVVSPYLAIKYLVDNGNISEDVTSVSVSEVLLGRAIQAGPMVAWNCMGRVTAMVQRCSARRHRGLVCAIHSICCVQRTKLCHARPTDRVVPVAEHHHLQAPRPQEGVTTSSVIRKHTRVDCMGSEVQRKVLALASSPGCASM